MLNAPFTDGQGQRNAYPVGPVLGPDAFWHMVWVWRETPDAETNHDLSYARSRDLVQWQTAAGANLTLPITLATSDIVDPVPVNGGMINNNTKVGFDAQNRPIVAYHKFDSAGNTQLYNARFENGNWVPHKTSSWTYRWAFSGQGTLVFEIQVEPVKVDAAGNLTQRWYHAQYGGWNAFALDPTTLAATAMLGRSLPYPASLETVESTTAGMHVRWAGRLRRRPRSDDPLHAALGDAGLEPRHAALADPAADAAASLRLQEVTSKTARPRPRLLFSPPRGLGTRPKATRARTGNRREIEKSGATPCRCRACGSSRTSCGRGRRRASPPLAGCRSRRAGSGCSSRGTASRPSAAASRAGPSVHRRQRRRPGHRRRARRRGPPQARAPRQQISAARQPRRHVLRRNDARDAENRRRRHLGRVGVVAVEHDLGEGVALDRLGADPQRGDVAAAEREQHEIGRKQLAAQRGIVRARPR